MVVKKGAANPKESPVTKGPYFHVKNKVNQHLLLPKLLLLIEQVWLLNMLIWTMKAWFDLKLSLCMDWHWRSSFSGEKWINQVPSGGASWRRRRQSIGLLESKQDPTSCFGENDSLSTSNDMEGDFSKERQTIRYYRIRMLNQMLVNSGFSLGVFMQFFTKWTDSNRTNKYWQDSNRFKAW